MNATQTILPPTQTAATPEGDTSAREIVITRLFDAPREMVFNAWADIKQIEQWWGPQGFTTTTEVFEFRPGGRWIHVMRGPDGREYPNVGKFLEIVPNERIVRTHGNGGDLSFHAVTTFADEDGKTRLTLKMVFPTVEMREFVVREHKAIEGGNQTLGRLAEFLTAREAVQPGYVLHISRMFSAPRELVYKAFIDPAMMAGWMGPGGFTAMDITQDVRPGGQWRLRLHQTADTTACDPSGQTDLWMHGTYIEVAPPERLVYTFTWEDRTDIPVYETTITVTFRELEGKTVMDFKQGPFLTAADRDGHNVGWSSAFDRFAEFVLAPAPASKPTHDLVIERTFDAPRELVWKVWTDPALAKEWAGPRGFNATHFEQDARVGGKWRLCLHADAFDAGDGVPRERNLWQGGVFKEIVEPERVVYTFAWDDPKNVGLDLPHHETLITVEFRDLGGKKTAMTFRQEFFLTAGERDGHNGGWSSAFERFAELVATQAAAERKA